MTNFVRKTLLFVLAMVCVAAAWYVVKNNESKILDAEVRQALGGHYVQLANGVVHYELLGDADQPLVVLVHGFSSPMYVFDPTVAALREKGFRVLRFDLFGRGFSDRIPESDYSLGVYVEQLHGLLNALQIDQPVSLLGLSMGGAIVTKFTASYPEMVDRVSLVAPLFETPERPEVALVKTPWLGEYLGTVVLVPRFINGAAETVFDVNSFPDWTEKFLPQTEYKGFSQALVQTARFLSGKSFQADYQALGALHKPVLLIWGKEDKIIGFSEHEKVQKAVPHLNFFAIEKAGHLPHYEKADIVNPIILNFISQ